MDEERFDALLRTESVVKDAKSLTQAWVPENKQKLLCRDSEITQLINIHRPILQEGADFSTNTLILGKGGIGKTITVRYFAKKFVQVALKKDISIVAEYFDCLQFRSKSAILRKILEKLHYSGGHGFADNEIMEQILHDLRNSNRYLLIILDEVHNLGSNDILSFFNASIGFGQKNSRFSIIAISRPIDWLKVETEMIKSRLQNTIKFEPYNKEEAMDILKYRRNLAFREGVINDETLELIADIVVENKNMRTGIDILRACGKHADQYNLNEITPEIVLKARNEITPAFKEGVIDSLKIHELIALLSVARTLKISKESVAPTDEIYEMYTIISEEYNRSPHKITSFRKYLRQLANLKIINKKTLNPTIEKKGRNAIFSLLDITPEKLEEIVSKKLQLLE